MAGYTPVIPVGVPQMYRNYIAQQATESDSAPTGVLDVAPKIDVPNVAAVTDVTDAAGASVDGTFWRNGDGSLNTENLKLGLGGIQTLGALWNAFQKNKIAKESLSLQRKAFETNLANQTQNYNTSLEDRIRARYATEGRSGEANAYIAKHRL